MKMYAAYLKERQNVDLVEVEHGFATYSLEENYIYLQDLYVVPEKRKEGIGVELMNIVAQIGKEAGKDRMLGSVSPSTKFSTTMTQIMFGLNFKILSSSQDIIYFVKEI